MIEFLSNLNFYETIIAPIALAGLYYLGKKIHELIKYVKSKVEKLKDKKSISRLHKKWYADHQPTYRQMVEIQQKIKNGEELSEWEKKAYEKHVKPREERWKMLLGNKFKK